MQYAIGAPYPDPNSAGVSALYKLSRDLKEMGQRSRIVNLTGYEKIRDNEILVLPDTIIGNPMRAPRVIRYALMYPGYFGHDRNFPASELMYYHSPDFILDGRSPDNILTIPVSDEARFPYKTDGRSGTCYLARKYKNAFGYAPPDRQTDWIEITHATDLGRLFGSVKRLVTYDNSAINLEAAMCGVTVDFRFNEAFIKPISLGSDFDWSCARESYMRLKERYRSQQLPEFISRTQEHFK